MRLSLGHGVNIQSASRIGTPPSNSVAPVASGTNEVGETLSCTTGTWVGSAPISYTYQWRRDGVDIASATSSTYVLVSADAETDVDCNVTATNFAGSATADSNNITIAAEGDGSLSDVIASAVFDLDATQAASYTSGTTWSNLVTAPADGSAQTAYDFYTGNGSTSTTYPTFNGSAGSAAAYWSFDGGDYFGIKSGANTAFFNALHKTTGGTAFWFAITLHKTDNTWSTAALLANLASSTNYKGIEIGVLSTEVFSFGQGNGAGSATNNSGVQTSGDFIVIYSYDGSGNIRRWVNTTTATTTAISFTASSDNAAYPMRIGSWGDGSRALNAETRIYSVAGGNEYLDNTKAAAIIAALEARHARDYTP